MSRVGPLALIVLLAASALGCTACGTPFDYCSATYNPHLDPCGGCDDCRENVRLGSNLSDDSIAPLSYHEPIEQAAPAERRPTIPTEELPEPDDSMLPELKPPGAAPSADEEMMPLEEPSLEAAEQPAEMPAEEPAAAEPSPEESLPAEPTPETAPAEEPPADAKPPAAEEPAAEQPAPAPARSGWRPARSRRR